MPIILFTLWVECRELKILIWICNSFSLSRRKNSYARINHTQFDINIKSIETEHWIYFGISFCFDSEWRRAHGVHASAPLNRRNVTDQRAARNRSPVLSQHTESWYAICLYSPHMCFQRTKSIDSKAAQSFIIKHRQSSLCQSGWFVVTVVFYSSHIYLIRIIIHSFRSKSLIVFHFARNRLSNCVFCTCLW